MAVCLFSLIGIVAVGPQRVWAALRGWISFVPGLGFADTEDVRILETPVVVSTEKLTLSITQVVVEKETSIVFAIRGLPEMDPIPTNRIIDMQGLSLHLRLPDGRILRPIEFEPPYATVYQVTGRAVFPRLPDGITNAILELTADPTMATLPLPAGGISATLTLLSASDEVVAGQFPEPHILENVSASHHGITMSVKRAVYGVEQIALDVEFQNVSSWFLVGGWPDALYDDTPRGYTPLLTDLPLTARRPYYDPQNKVAMTFTFEPALRPEAKSLILLIDSIYVYTDSEPLPITFTLDFGVSPSLSRTWPLDIAFDIADLPYRIVEARLKDEANFWNPNDTATQYFLEVDFEELPIRGDLQRSSLVLETSHEAFTGASYGRYYRTSVGDNFSIITLGFDTLPQGNVTFTVSTAYLMLRGPWRVTWDVP
jgi:hypothetical protein